MTPTPAHLSPPLWWGGHPSPAYTIPPFATTIASISAHGGHRSRHGAGGEEGHSKETWRPRGMGLLLGWETPGGEAELSRVTAKEGPLLPSPVPVMAVRTWQLLFTSPSGGLALSVAPEPRAARAMNRLNPSFPCSHSGLGKKLSPPKWSEGRCLGKVVTERGTWFTETLPLLPQSPRPAPPPQQSHF